MATTREIASDASAAFQAAIRSPPSRTNSVSRGSMATSAVRVSDPDTASRTGRYTGHLVFGKNGVVPVASPKGWGWAAGAIMSKPSTVSTRCRGRVAARQELALGTAELHADPSRAVRPAPEYARALEWLDRTLAPAPRKDHRGFRSCGLTKSLG